jgi:hypothetical protein
MEARHRMPKPPISAPPTPTLASQPVSGSSVGKPANNIRHAEMNVGSAEDDFGSPSEQAGHDPAPTRHEPGIDAQRGAEKEKYEAADTFRPRKGNRFS